MNVLFDRRAVVPNGHRFPAGWANWLATFRAADIRLQYAVIDYHRADQEVQIRLGDTAILLSWPQVRFGPLVAAGEFLAWYDRGEPKPAA